MFNQLILTGMILTGVASNTTPVYNAKETPLTIKAEDNSSNPTQTYSLQLTQVGQTNSATYTQQETGNPTRPSGSDFETIKNFQAYNIAVNVLATVYTTNVRTDDGTGLLFVMNANYSDQTPTTYPYTTRTTLVMQIDGYNYNDETTTSLMLQLGIDDSSLVDNNTYQVTQKQYQRSVYTCTENDWSGYIGKQSTTFGGYRVIEEIDDANNNYLYTKVTSTVLTNELNRTDIVPIDLLPNATTYIVIDYVPIYNIRMNGQPLDSSIPTIPLEFTNYLTMNSIYINGTNTIPTSRYEVVNIPGLMFDILTMPFMFVSQAFNVTLFPGTPYQVNISKLFLAIIALAVFIFIIRFIIKLKG